MEFWVLILTVWAFFRWVLTRIRRRKEDERFANVIEALNKFEARFRDVTRLEKRVQELEQKLASSGTAAAPPAPPPVEHLPVVVPPPIEIPKLIVPAAPVPPVAPALPVAEEVHPPAPKTPVPVVPPAKPVVPPPTPVIPHAPAPMRPTAPPLSATTTRRAGFCTGDEFAT